MLKNIVVRNLDAKYGALVFRIRLNYGIYRTAPRFRFFWNVFYWVLNLQILLRCFYLNDDDGDDDDDNDVKEVANFSPIIIKYKTSF